MHQCVGTHVPVSSNLCAVQLDAAETLLASVELARAQTCRPPDPYTSLAIQLQAPNDVVTTSNSVKNYQVPTELEKLSIVARQT